MRIFAIDDEPKLLRLLHRAIEEAAPGAEIIDYPLGSRALEAMETGLKPDFVFADIQMPGMSGLALAKRMKALSPAVKIVFVTGYQEYAYDALKMHINGYIMKPVTAERVREELEYNCPVPAPAMDKLTIKCFGYFEVFYQGRPLIFSRRQTKELLAYLIDREGTVCTSEEIAAVLWEDENDMRAMKARIRQLISDLRSTLGQIGMEEALIRHRGQLGIRRDMVDCDYYRMLDGDLAALNSFKGEYMEQYSWASFSEGTLYFRE